MVEACYDGGNKGELSINFLYALPSGLSVVYDDIPSVGTTALALFVAVGSRDERPHEWGMAHLLEHLVFKGAADRDHRAIARQMDLLGSDINAFTTRDYTCFHAKVLDAEAVSAYQLLRDMVRAPWLREEDLEREKQVVREEMKESLDDPDEILDTLITEALYDDLTYTHDILGTLESLNGALGSGLKAFYGTHYEPANMVLAISGGAVGAVRLAVQEDFGHGAASSALPHRRAVPRLSLRTREQSEDFEQVKLAVGVSAPSRYDPGYAAALMTASILGGQNSSRLWQRLREQDGLVYTVGTQYAPETDFGDMITYLGLGPESVDEAMRAFSEEVTRLAQEGPDDAELEYTRRYLNTVLVMNQETPDARVMRMGRYALDGLVTPELDALARALDAVTRHDVCARAQVWLVDSPRAVAACGPVANIAGLATVHHAGETP